MPKHKRRDIFWIAVVATLILAFSAIPNWVGYRAHTAELAYKGIFFDPQDYAVHMSMLQAGMQGDWAYQFRYTTEAHQGAYTRLFYLALGQTNRIFQLNPTVIFEIARWLFGYLALFAIYALTKRVVKETLWQRVAFLLAVFGSGLGWLQLIFGWVPGPITPIDFWLIDAYVFFGIALFPHFAFVTAALCLVFLLYLDYLEKGGWMRITAIAAIAILTQFVNPIAFVLVDLALATATFTIWFQKRKIDWGQFAALSVIAIAQFPLLVYNFNLLSNDPIWSQFTRQNETLSPPPVYYLWGFGLLWLFALIGLFPAARQQNLASLGAAAWILTGLVLAYTPFAIQRRFLHGVTIPLALLSTQGLKMIIQFLSQKSAALARRTISLTIAVVFLISLSSLYLSLGRSLYLLNQPDEFFYPASLNSALDWLDENAVPNDFVLSAVPSGQLIAQKTNLRVYLGHPMETLDFDAKSRLVTAFFQGQANPGWLEDTKVRWVLYGPYELALTGNTNFHDTVLDIVYRSAEITIYRVKQ
ncbi:MAG: hypothetical protein JW963_10395 [Anaerolineales bacterium]|nr:hypothetical protein [Anaerolineales bacterium]